MEAEAECAQRAHDARRWRRRVTLYPCRLCGTLVVAEDSVRAKVSVSGSASSDRTARPVASRRVGSRTGQAQGPRASGREPTGPSEVGNVPVPKPTIPQGARGPLSHTRARTVNKYTI